MILLVPTLKKGRGSGHLKRMLRLHRRLPDSSIYLERNDNPVWFPFFDDCRADVTVGKVPSETSAAVFDSFRTVAKQLKTLPSETIRIGIDEGGRFRSRFDYLIDILPSVRGGEKPNYESLALLNREDFKKRRRKTVRSILVSFGGEDAAELTRKTAEFLISAGWDRRYSITVLSPRLNPDHYPTMSILPRVKDLASCITDWDLVLTHFGLTAFEALFQNVSVLLINPTRYHRRLTRKAGLPEAGLCRPDEVLLNEWLSHPEAIPAPLSELTQSGSVTLSGFFAAREFSGSPTCPVCGKRGKTVFRSSTKTVYHCRRCSLFYELLWKKPEKRYDKDYFFQEYSQSYGKTYLEDFDSIKENGFLRLKEIERLMPPKFEVKRRLLDVGCAYGPFLQAAAEKGWDVCGCEVCGEAAGYVEKNLRLPVRSVSFEDYPESGLKFDAVVMWFVIEHFEKLDEILKKVSRISASNGVFAFSTPNGSGWSRRKSLKKFLERSPEDHYTILTPRGVRKILRRYGYRVRKIRMTGIHPERIFSDRGADSFPTPIYRILCTVFRILRWGDTFEVYAQKK